MCIRDRVWNERLLAICFWSLNIGLAGMALLSLLPFGLMQVWASVETGFWYARSAEFLQTPFMDFLVWMRVPGDLVFTLGVLALAWFVYRLWIPGKSHPEPIDRVGQGAL